jgi:hypothetical protein
LEVRRAEEIETVLARAIIDRIDALIPSVDRIFDTPRAKILDFAIKNRLPTMYHTSGAVEQGGLMSYALISRTFSGAPQRTSTKFSKAPDPLTYQSSNRQSLSS